MATPTAKSYSAASGGTIAGGRNLIPAWIAAMPVGQWFTAPNSAVSSVAGATLMDVYSGTVLAGDKLYSFGGGHGASVDNTVAVYDLQAGASWSVACSISPAGDRVYADNTNYGVDRTWWGISPNRKPNPCHTYSSGVYAPDLGRIIWTGQRGVYSLGGNPVPNFWLQFKIPGHVWVDPSDAETIQDQQFGRASVRLPDGRIVGSSSGSSIWCYDPSQPSGSQFTLWASNSALDWGGYGQYLVDEVGNRLIRVGSIYHPTGLNVIMAVDMTTKAVTNIRALMTGSTDDLAGLDALNVQDTPGACIDKVNNRIVYPTGAAGGSFYAIDLATLAVTLVSPATVSGHSVAAKPSSTGGIFAKIHFHPTWNVLVYNPAGSAQTCLMRLA